MRHLKNVYGILFLSLLVVGCLVAVVRWKDGTTVPDAPLSSESSPNTPAVDDVNNKTVDNPETTWYITRGLALIMFCGLVVVTTLACIRGWKHWLWRKAIADEARLSFPYFTSSYYPLETTRDLERVFLQPPEHQNKKTLCQILIDYHHQCAKKLLKKICQQRGNNPTFPEIEVPKQFFESHLGCFWPYFLDKMKHQVACNTITDEWITDFNHEMRAMEQVLKHYLVSRERRPFEKIQAFFVGIDEVKKWFLHGAARALAEKGGETLLRTYLANIKKGFNGEKYRCLGPDESIYDKYIYKSFEKADVNFYVVFVAFSKDDELLDAINDGIDQIPLLDHRNLYDINCIDTSNLTIRE